MKAQFIPFVFAVLSSCLFAQIPDSDYTVSWLYLQGASDDSSSLLVSKKLPDGKPADLFGQEIHRALVSQSFPESMVFVVASQGQPFVDFCIELSPGLHSVIELNQARAGDTVPLSGKLQTDCSSLTSGYETDSLSGEREFAEPEPAKNAYLLFYLLERKEETVIFGSETGVTPLSIPPYPGSYFSWFDDDEGDDGKKKFWLPNVAKNDLPVLAFLSYAPLHSLSLLSGWSLPWPFSKQGNHGLTIQLVYGDGREQLLSFSFAQARELLGLYELSPDHGLSSDLLWFLMGEGEVNIRSTNSLSQNQLSDTLNTIKRAFDGFHATTVEMPSGILTYGQCVSKKGKTSSNTGCSGEAPNERAAGRQNSILTFNLGSPPGGGQPPDQPVKYDREPGAHYREEPLYAEVVEPGARAVVPQQRENESLSTANQAASTDAGYFVVGNKGSDKAIPTASPSSNEPPHSAPPQPYTDFVPIQWRASPSSRPGEEGNTQSQELLRAQELLVELTSILESLSRSPDTTSVATQTDEEATPLYSKVNKQRSLPAGSDASPKQVEHHSLTPPIPPRSEAPPLLPRAENAQAENAALLSSGPEISTPPISLPLPPGANDMPKLELAEYSIGIDSGERLEDRGHSPTATLSSEIEAGQSPVAPPLPPKLQQREQISGNTVAQSSAQVTYTEISHDSGAAIHQASSPLVLYSELKIQASEEQDEMAPEIPKKRRAKAPRPKTMQVSVSQKVIASSGALHDVVNNQASPYDQVLEAYRNLSGVIYDNLLPLVRQWQQKFTYGTSTVGASTLAKFASTQFKDYDSVKKLLDSKRGEAGIIKEEFQQFQRMLFYLWGMQAYEGIYTTTNAIDDILIHALTVKKNKKDQSYYQALATAAGLAGISLLEIYFNSDRLLSDNILYREMIMPMLNYAVTGLRIRYKTSLADQLQHHIDDLHLASLKELLKNHKNDIYRSLMFLSGDIYQKFLLQ